MSQFPLHQEGGSHRDLESGGVHVPGPSRSQWNPAHLNLAPPSSEMIITIICMVWMILGFLLNLNYPINGGDFNKVLNALFHQNPISFYFIVIIGTAAFYLTSAWLMMIVGRFRPPMARNLALVILLLGVLSVTVLLNALLSNKFSWILWIFFAVTIWITLVMEGCERAIRWTDKIRMLVMQGCDRATRWTDKIRTSVVEGVERARQSQ
ncbi:uncharacterized protein LOC131258043 [Magnolia sinica]|uniref:uncharacterized protein LOC131258043 n=1 Tax=Magnolia sinica TaxID=86752 RepID=UPI00265864EB|nr:uncharacterized protein LOC131258043 [Magnolia sinica]XP_058115065.1 uncharacterized protein LOC131258043 [Magnolia sinica]XP_058115066.1 uncharacterized protein LOC131258043 [Magnolia sinica]XP_058115067.1 uncharacterized protein LOC131258043 [Magnolia sinica]XP_058115068.1 uncharacterized protein LOC131258043 [Magnolia sinica]XP_058115069.1 uncharacterized protein LOC131258043 [Magnolia sinica]XP_058115070.1 uncharacterized protein LOC131258043 [Magnolia sinica]XP_058115071.1 uncharacte